MTISEKELHNLGELAYLDSGNEHAHALISEINAIIDFVTELKSIDTQHVAPLFHPVEHQQTLREDTVSEHDCSRQLAEIAPLFDEGFYWVPKVIDAGE